MHLILIVFIETCTLLVLWGNKARNLMDDLFLQDILSARLNYSLRETGSTPSPMTIEPVPETDKQQLPIKGSIEAQSTTHRNMFRRSDTNKRHQKRKRPPDDAVSKPKQANQLNLKKTIHPGKESDKIPVQTVLLNKGDNKTSKDGNGNIEDLFEKDSDGDTALHLTVVHNDEIKSEYLVKLMATKTLDIFNKLYQTPLHLAVLTCQPVTVRLLVSNGASVNVRDRNGQTPLHLASKNADVDSVNAIMEGMILRSNYPIRQYSEVDCNLKNFQGQAALHLAILSGSRGVAKILLEMNANINVQDGTSGKAPLHHAVEVHNVNMVEFVLQNNADVNITTYSGNTALHIAMAQHMEEVIRILMKYGANINKKNFEGETPLDLKIGKQSLKREHVGGFRNTLKRI